MHICSFCYSRFLNVVLSDTINCSTNIETAAVKVVESYFRPTSRCSICPNNSVADPDMTHEDLGLLVKKWINIHYILPDEVVTFLLEVVIDHCVISKAAPPLEG